MMRVSIMAGLIGCGLGQLAWGQSSSLFLSPAASSTRFAGRDSGASRVAEGDAGFAAKPPRESGVPMTRTLEQASLVATVKAPPRKFKPEDLITIIVRQQKKYDADAKFDREKKWDIEGKLQEWFRFYPDHKLGTDQLSNGQPGFQFNYDDKYETDAQNERQDTFTTRIQAKVIDVKPNGNLVLEASQEEKHDEEHITMTLTGVCRSEDVTADNTVLSTQIAELVLVEKNSGAMRDSTRRGWIPRILDWVRPF